MPSHEVWAAAPPEGVEAEAVGARVVSEAGVLLEGVFEDSCLPGEDARSSEGFGLDPERPQAAHAGGHGVDRVRRGWDGTTHLSFLRAASEVPLAIGVLGRLEGVIPVVEVIHSLVVEVSQGHIYAYEGKGRGRERGGEGK